MAATPLKPVELSCQPLAISFRGVGGGGGGGGRVVACGLADGTVEVHDLTEEEDTIVASVAVHSSEAPSRTHSLPSALGVAAAAAGGLSFSSAPPSKSADAPRSPSCRSVLFSRDGSRLFTAGNGGGLACLDAARASVFSPGGGGRGVDGGGDSGTPPPDDHPPLLWYIPDAHVQGGTADGRDAGISRLHQLPEPCRAGPLLVSGDDGGRVRLWDVRICGGGGAGAASSKKRSRGAARGGGLEGDPLPRGCVMAWSHHDDYVSGFDSSLDNGTALLVSSADGTLSVLDVRRPGPSVRNLCPHPARARTTAGTLPGDAGTDPTLLGRSDRQDNELLSLCVLKRGRKVVCGTADGVLAVWSYGTWGDVSDRFPGHPSSVDTLLKVDEDTLLTGSSDGLIRAVSIQPDRLLGILGNCGGLPVEALAFGAWEGEKPRVLGAIGHDDVVRLWDTGVLFDNDSDRDSDDGNSDDRKSGRGGEKVGGSADPLAASAASAGAAAALAAGSDDEWEFSNSSDNDDDLEDGGRGQKRRKGGKGGGQDAESDDSESDGSEEGGWGGGRRGRPKLKTEAERFFEEL